MEYVIQEARETEERRIAEAVRKGQIEVLVKVAEVVASMQEDIEDSIDGLEAIAEFEESGEETISHKDLMAELGLA